MNVVVDNEVLENYLIVARDNTDRWWEYLNEWSQMVGKIQADHPYQIHNEWTARLKVS